MEAKLELAAANGCAEGNCHFGRGIPSAAFCERAVAVPAGRPAEVREDVPRSRAALPEAFTKELTEVDILGTEATARFGPPTWVLWGSFAHGFE